MKLETTAHTRRRRCGGATNPLQLQLGATKGEVRQKGAGCDHFFVNHLFCERYMAATRKWPVVALAIPRTATLHISKIWESGAKEWFKRHLESPFQQRSVVS